VVPSATDSDFVYTNWINIDEVARRHALELWSDGFWTMLGRYAKLMSRGRQNAILVPLRRFVRPVRPVSPGANAKAKSGSTSPAAFDEARLKRYVETFRTAGFKFFEGGHLAARPAGDWGATDLQLFSGALVSSAEGTREATHWARAIDRVLTDNGWRDAWFQHLADEPSDTNAAAYRALAAAFRAGCEGVPIVDATLSRELVGAIDVWCPQVHDFEEQRRFFAKRRAQGDRVWVYTCLSPGGPWLNRLLDQERLRPVWIGWAAAHRRLDGFLHWGLNQYQADPFAQSVVDHHAAGPGTKNRLPAGDTHIVYPGRDGPWSSVRFEAHRIGMEDRELLEQLRVEDEDSCARVIDRVVRRFDLFATDVPRYRAAKRLLLEQLGDGR
ncbi:MAG: DUF4091 domain-containing protein, partial [Gammaproteobacteria bacterium]|nr:DUF4091 domain-containing protein [Gammaproteobacteria bacterium]